MIFGVRRVPKAAAPGPVGTLGSSWSLLLSCRHTTGVTPRKTGTLASALILIGMLIKSHDPRLHAIRAGLRDEWDPISIGADPDAADEYDSYAVRVYACLAAGWTRRTRRRLPGRC